MQPTINDKFATLAEALYVAERKARAEVEMRLEVQKKLLLKEKEQQEMKLRDMAFQAREERAGLTRIDAGPGGAGAGSAQNKADDDDDAEEVGPWQFDHMSLLLLLSSACMKHVCCQSVTIPSCVPSCVAGSTG
jgi:hypothetical protein